MTQNQVDIQSSPTPNPQEVLSDAAMSRVLLAMPDVYGSSPTTAELAESYHRCSALADVSEKDSRVLRRAAEQLDEHALLDEQMLERVMRKENADR